eukprot:COSAG05_NODE_60_length_23142_cov_25.372130_21_plen_56_part_00
MGKHTIKHGNKQAREPPATTDQGIKPELAELVGWLSKRLSCRSVIQQEGSAQIIR